MTELSYHLAMPAPQSHLFEVRLAVPTSGEAVELVMPSWTPGSYLLREFARNVQDFRAESAAGDPLPWTKTDKSTWRVEPPAGGAGLRVFYRVYANELTVRTSHLDTTHGYVNGASVFMLVRGLESEPVALTLDAPGGWRATTSLHETAPFRFEARHYDELVDSPIEIGTHELVEWEQSGIRHAYAIWGRGNHDRQRLVEDTRRIIAAAESMFGGLPYPRYLFIVHLFPEGRGGLEHRDSTSLQADRWSFQGEEYENFLALVAHEFFHVWNAKRIRPAPLGAFDYTRENYTTNLWVVEGLTTYYTDLLLRRAGIITAERYLERLADSIARFEALPGRRHQTLAESSFDTWIRFYRPDENTPNSQISYYHKGALVGLLLDMELRRLTSNERSLDDLMRALWERYGVWDVGFPESGEGSVEALASELADADLSEFFDRHIRGTDELDYGAYLGAAGVALSNVAGAVGVTPKPPTDAALLEARLGIRTREQEGRLRVATVLSDSPALAARLQAGDEIIALDGLRVSTAGQLARRLSARATGESARVTVFRRDELVTLAVALGEGPAPRLRLARAPDPSAEQRAVWEGWLGEAGASLDPAPAEG